MANKNRSTLKRYFREGALPSANQFEDLIDSTVNKINDGFDKSSKNGFEISLLGDYNGLISFFRSNAVFQTDGDRQAEWSISYDKENDRLLFVRRPGQEGETRVLVLDPEGWIGVNTSAPQWELDVAGVIAAEGRIGANPRIGVEQKEQKTVPADGGWHTIVDNLSGCQAFEVMAGVGNKGTGMYALMHAVALNTYNPSGLISNLFRRKNRIKYNHAYYLSRGHKIKLRWVGDRENYQLQMGTNCDYGKDNNDTQIGIRYYITKLWFDETMQEARWYKPVSVDNNTYGED